MKKVMFLILVLAFIFGVGSGTIFAQVNGNSLDASADVYAEVLEAFDVTNLEGEDLDFGTLAAAADSGGTIIVDAGDTGTGSTANIPYHDGVFQAAGFEITGGYSGETSINYSIELPTSVTIDNNNGASMIVDNFTSDLTSNEGIISGGSDTFYVGATLNVGAAQETGSYSGSFEVTVTLE
ncbi:MAG: DUF4402 domain-containing protein [Halanaerobiales bacterium]|nr:DUF4402 domain-containing protein [Halanaerobiales bacterium]